jgi:FMN phosphatase YigB (HAD superfamily)
MAKDIDLSLVKVVSWDIDGTMYDLHALMSAFKWDLFRRMLSLGWVAAWRDFFRLLRFKRFMDKVRSARGDYAVGSVPDRDAIGQTQAEMYGRILPQIGVEPGVKDLMTWFTERGTPQVVFSDYRPSTKLSALGLDRFFDRVYAGEDLGHLKPAPAVFRAILDDLGLEPAELLHIGDRPDTDGAAASEVGYQVATATDLLGTLQHAEDPNE